jgi:hypothetical protein
MTMDVFLRYVLPALIGATSAFLSVWVSLRVQTRQIEKDEDASLRADLMEERRGFVTEIRELSTRCSELEQTNIKYVKEVIRLREQVQCLTNEVKRLRGVTTDEPTT